MERTVWTFALSETLDAFSATGEIVERAARYRVVRATFGSRWHRGAAVTTDGNGRYSISVYQGQNGLWVTKAGYEVDGRPALPDCDTCNALVNVDADTRFDIQVVRR